MSKKQEFYDIGHGDFLVNEGNYPNEIQEFLKSELVLLNSFSSQFVHLIEVGCMNGRHLDWAISFSKKYLGIDIVQRYIDDAKKTILSLGVSLPDYEAELCSIEKISSLLSNKKIDQFMLFFPFNSFGNMKAAYPVLKVLKNNNYPFLISSYQTNKQANESRLTYYKKCGYKNIECIDDEKGIRFISEEGLNTIAYHPTYLEKIFEELGMIVNKIPFCKIGMGYKSY